MAKVAGALEPVPGQQRPKQTQTEEVLEEGQAEEALASQRPHAQVPKQAWGKSALVSRPTTQVLGAPATQTRLTKNELAPLDPPQNPQQ